MKRTIALVLTLLLIAALGVFASSADTVELLPKESEWEFLTYEGEANALPEEEEPELWLSNGEYTDLSGQAPFACQSTPAARKSLRESAQMYWSHSVLQR